MASYFLTQALVDKLCGDGQRESIYDRGVRGLVLRLGKSGSKTWCVEFRPRRKRVLGGGAPAAPQEGNRRPTRRVTLGSANRFDPGRLTLEEARARARSILDAAKAGRDPVAEGRAALARALDEEAAQREQEARERAESEARRLGNLLPIFASTRLQHASRRHRDETLRLLTRYVLPRWADRDIATITRADLIELLEGIIRPDDSGAPRRITTLHRVASAITTFFGWAMLRNLLSSVPTLGIKRALGAPREVPRDRVLADRELGIIWRATESLPPHWCGLFRFLIATGARRGEAALATWREFDLKQRTWHLAPSRTKARRGHSLPLSPLALRILASLPRQAGDDDGFVFGSPRNGAAPTAFARVKRQLDAKIAELCRGVPPVEPWRVHDLRRTVASGLARLGTPQIVIGRILNHSPRGITATVYDRHGYLPEMRRSLDGWSRHVAKLVGGGGAATPKAKEGASGGRVVRLADARKARRESVA